jgi:hypothetical protein
MLFCTQILCCFFLFSFIIFQFNNKNCDFILILSHKFDETLIHYIRWRKLYTIIWEKKRTEHVLRAIATSSTLLLCSFWWVWPRQLITMDIEWRLCILYNGIALCHGMLPKFWKQENISVLASHIHTPAVLGLMPLSRFCGFCCIGILIFDFIQETKACTINKQLKESK